MIKSSLQAPLLHLAGRREFAALDFGAGEALDELQFVDVAPGDKCRRQPLAPGAAGAADAMHIILGVVGQVVVHHQFQLVHIDPARRDIRGDEKFKFRLLEFVHHARALGLRQPAVQTVGRDALRHQIIREFIDHPLRVAKNNAQLEPMKIDEPQERLALVAMRHFKIPLLDRRHRQRLLFDLHRLRLARMPLDQIPDRLRHRRREKHRLPLLRRGFQNVLDVIAEAHVEHPVRLVEHHHLHGVEP